MKRCHRVAEDFNIIGLITARGGSKGIPGKNIKTLNGYPLIAYSIWASKLSRHIKRTILSTDSQEIARIAKEYQAEVPFMRPKELARDNSTDLEVIRHAINWLSKREDLIPDLIVHIRPTTPLRDPREIDKAIERILSCPAATSLRSIQELSEPPQKMFQLDSNGFLKGFFSDDTRPEYYNLPRQMFPAAYHPNGYVDIIKTDFVMSNNSLHGPNILGFITPFSIEVDRPEDFEYLRYQLKKTKNPLYEYLKNNFFIKSKNERL